MPELRRLFFPDHPKYRKAHALRPPAFLLYLGFLLLLNVTFQIVVKVRPGILGFSSSIIAEDLVNLTNEKRAANGLPLLTYSPVLTQAAASKGQDMFSYNYWSHVSPLGVDPWTWIRQAGYTYQFAGENLAKDFVDSASVVEAWMNSPTHRDNVLSDRFKEVGIAVLDGNLSGYQTTLVVQMFATPAPATLAQAKPSPSPSATSIQPPSSPETLLIAGQEVQAEKWIGPQTDEVRLSSPSPRTAAPLIESFAVVRSASVSLLFLLLGLIGMDILLVNRRRIVRVGGHSLAHALMFGILLVAIWYTQVGVIL
jgi:hypothetical protein